MVASQSWSPFQLEGELRTQFGKVGTPVITGKSTYLFRSGDSADGVFLLMSGKVALSAGGAAKTHNSCLQGSLLGLPATVRNRTYSLTAQCLEDCECVRVSPEDFTALLCTDPTLCFRVVEMLANEVGELGSRLPEAADKADAS